MSAPCNHDPILLESGFWSVDEGDIGPTMCLPTEEEWKCCVCQTVVRKADARSVEPAKKIMLWSRDKHGTITSSLHDVSETTTNCAACGKPLVEPPSELVVLIADKTKCVACLGRDHER